VFFAVSKLAWFLIQPLVAVLVLAAVGLGFRLARFRRTGTWLMSVAAILLVVAALSPAGLLMTAALENRFPPPVLPARVDGIVVLGGSFDTRVAKSRGEPELNEAADRITVGMALARRFPEAKLIFSGGVAALFDDDIAEVVSAKQIFADLGLAEDRLLLEGRARNTAENAVYTKEMANPQPGETWLLVTSASHMPRSVGCFRVAGFDVIPYPVDYRTPLGDAVWWPSTTTTRNLEKVHFAVREYIGLVAYWMTGRTDALFPAPLPQALSAGEPSASPAG
jgi:uncharacterized SAM-binding protein YcdF (DUF218 family)